MSVKRVLIAHQSTIPHYRVRFYQEVERLRPNWWDFTVIYDAHETRKQFFLELDHNTFGFNIKCVRTHALKLGSRRMVFQTFPFTAWPYDLIVVGNSMHNLSYPLTSLWRLFGKSVAFWGQGRDTSVQHAVGLKGIAEKAKIWLTCRSDGFFAYTQSVHDFMQHQGLNEHKIFTLYNTIDIETLRSIFVAHIRSRDAYKKIAGLEGKKILLFVGRLNKSKRLDFLIETFTILRRQDSQYHLILIGGGDTSYISRLEEKCGKDAISYKGSVSEADINYFYIISDVYIFPGAVGLGPIQALCFDLTPVVIDSSVHNPEYDYLNETNAIICNRTVNPAQYAEAIDTHLQDFDQWHRMRSQAWPSMRHLTIEKMATNFVHGINALLAF
jgi:glycosyltransferase involved in cell wall biosynthesis